MKVVIPSKNRADTIEEGALHLFPDAIVCVAESERDDYLKVVPANQLLLHSDDVTGIAPIRQWILDNVDDEVVVQCDDDVSEVISLIGMTTRKIKDVDSIKAIVMQAAECASDAGCSVFGFNQSWDVRKFNFLKPFKNCLWVGGLIGIVGRRIKYDTSLKLRADIDFCLQSLLVDRIIWQDSRFAFVHKRWKGKGGNSTNRSAERHKAEIDYLKRKWGKYLQIEELENDFRLRINVDR